MKPVRVVHFITTLAVGGAEQMLVKLLRAMDRSEFEPTVVTLVNDGALPHTLLIEKVSGFKKLSVTGQGQTATGTATLEPGTYTIFCDVAGHRSAGMEAQLVIS